MPSQEIIEVVDDEEGNGSPGQSISPAAGQASKRDNDGGSKPSKRKITPMTNNSKQKEAPKKKGKQQAGIMGFFSKKKSPSTPFASNDNSKEPTKKVPAATASSKKPPKSNAEKKKETTAPEKGTKNQSKKPTPPVAKTNTNAKPASTSSSGFNKSRHSKMDFKDIAVGKLTGKKSPDALGKLNMPKDEKMAPPTPVTKEELDAMLPKVPPLSAVVRDTKLPAINEPNSAKSTQLSKCDLPLSQDDSEAGTPFGAVRNNLEEKFDSQKDPVHDEDTKEQPADGTVTTESQDMEDKKTAAKESQEEIPASSDDNAESNDVEMKAADESPDVAEDSEEVEVEIVEPKETEVETAAKESNNDQTENQMEVDDSSQPDDSSQSDDKSQAMEKSVEIATSPKTGAGVTPAKSRLDKQEAMVVKYCAQASELVAKARAGLDEESITIPLPSTDGIEIGSPEEFPDVAVEHLVCLLEGSKLPLAELAVGACNTLNEAFNGASLSVDVVSAKIKVLASRRAYVKNPAIAKGVIGPNNLGKDVDTFEDGNPDHMWRWEVTSTDLLPDGSVKQIKLARSAGSKLMKQWNATASLLKALDDSLKLLRDSPNPPPQEKIDKALAKISKEEERVLKYEREEEAKKQKANKSRQKEEKKKAAEEKKMAAEERKREKERKAREKEEAKKEKEEEARKKQEKEERRKQKQAQKMMSFFSTAKKQTPKSSTSTTTVQSAQSAKPTSTTADNASKPIATKKNGFDEEEFRARINSQSVAKETRPFASLSKRARASRKRKTKLVEMRVFVSGQTSDNNGFAPQAFAKELVVKLRNRNKFLRFNEDDRPAYHGTWSKKCATKHLGRKPTSKEPCFDYDYDSEVEWEKGDDDPGEDIENDAGDDEEERALDRLEEGDTKKYNYGDGWLQEDDDIIREDPEEMDDDTKKLVKATRKDTDVAAVPVCIVAPAMGGLPVVEAHDQDDPRLQGRIEGFPVQDAFKLVLAHESAILVTDTDLFLDAFPPSLVEERDGSATASGSPQSKAKEPSKEDLRTCAKFLHNSKHVSKAIAVEEMRKKYPSVTTSRAQATRVLESMVVKKRLSGVVYWEIKPDVIKDLGLEHELKPMEIPEKTPDKAQSKKRKAANASDTSCDQPKKKKAKAQPSGGSGPNKKQASLMAAFLKMPVNK
ncbi:Chromatin assembly factor 1 subunit A [Seminavis robusta]|uniref:Chromatin assembly factor 1 subunit A n=1 Tax=Seminavis robusta TaxID=568900 RepID=A0A9N8DDJ9_9STRA|nr:Chromatin assembly factor 1 subunit A [Seminavis robusta]|eukprot:Sro104_g053050.1 Chromatin assembly factor 1 subunit A (1166) ;mRNA; f:115887-119634